MTSDRVRVEGERKTREVDPDWWVQEQLCQLHVLKLYLDEVFRLYKRRTKEEQR